MSIDKMFFYLSQKMPRAASRTLLESKIRTRVLLVESRKLNISISEKWAPMKNVEITSKSPSESRARSVAYPAVSLEVAIELINELEEKLGKGPYSREDAAKGIGYSSISGPSASRIAALKHYGLLDRFGNTYARSDLAYKIMHPVTEAEKKSSIVAAALTPKLFDKLARQFNKHALPSLFANILMREGISKSAAADAAKIFRETLHFAGLMPNGVVSVETAEENGRRDEPVHDDAPHPGLETTRQPDVPVSSISSTSFAVTKPFVFNDEGMGWSIGVRSNKPMGTGIKTKLLEVADLLEQINREDAADL